MIRYIRLLIKESIRLVKNRGDYMGVTIINTTEKLYSNSDFNVEDIVVINGYKKQILEDGKLLIKRVLL